MPIPSSASASHQLDPLRQSQSQDDDDAPNDSTQDPRRSSTPSSSTLQVDDALRPPSRTSSHPTRDQNKPSSQPTSPHLRLFSQLEIYSFLIFISFWGVLARLGLEWLGSFSSDQVFPLIWAQIVGCTIMGFVVDRKDELERLYPPLYVMLGTGFCGSLTSFSTWMYDVFIAFANINNGPTYGDSSRFKGFLSGLAITLVTLGLSSISLQLGVHLSSFLPTLPNPSPSSSSSRTSHIKPLRLISLSLPLLSYLIALLLVFLAPQTWRKKATLAILFGPPGTLLRYFLSTRLNPIFPSFPLGTFTSNILSTLIFASIEISKLSLSPSSSSSHTLKCATLQALQDGFCGALSTVSTFVVELRVLKRGEGWRYFWGSWGVGQVGMMLVLGSWWWSVGEREKGMGGECI